MATRVILNGRPVLGLRPREVLSAGWVPRVVRVDDVDELGQPRSLPVARREGPRTGIPWTDDDGTVYRVVARLDPGEGWVGADTIMRWYKLPYTEVARWVQLGLLDGALEETSPSKRYRVLDPARALREAAAFHGRPPPAPGSAPARGAGRRQRRGSP